MIHIVSHRPLYMGLFPTKRCVMFYVNAYIAPLLHAGHAHADQLVNAVVVVTNPFDIYIFKIVSFDYIHASIMDRLETLEIPLQMSAIIRNRKHSTMSLSIPSPEHF